ncbi:MAG TPA: AsmA family protein [Terriglobia bacterium]|nr:AsmA family protein [Terriglobia bacterium]
MSKGKKVTLILVIVLVLIVVGLAIIIPMLFNVDRYRPQVAAQIQQETGKPAQIGRLALTILPEVAIRVDDFSLGNPAGFPTGDFAKAKKIYVVVNPFALLHRKVEITSLEMDDLTIDMLENAHGKWNFENSPAKDPPPPDPPGDSSASFTLGIISKLTVERGQFAAASLLASGVPGPSLMEVHGASIDLRQVNFNALTNASLREPASAPGELALLAGWLNTIVYAADPVGPAVAQGSLKADTMHIGNVDVTKVKSKIRLYPKQVFIDDLDLKCYGGSATGNLSLNFGGANLAYSVDARLKGVNVAEFLNAFPQAKGLMTGTLEATAKANGTVVHSSDPLAGITGSGQASIRNGKMPSLQLGSNLRSLAKMANVGPANGDPSSFSSLSSDFRIADGRLSSKKITLVGNGVDVDGSGSLTAAGDGTLDYQGDASLAANSNNPLATVLGGFAGAKFANGKMTFPFNIGGTFAKPKFSLKGGAAGAGGAPKAAAQEPVDVVKGISGLLKKKKPQ